MAVGRKTGGRQKGTPNKINATLREAILLAAHDAHPDGMVAYLTDQARNNATAFLTLLGKVLPTQIAGDPDNPVETVNRIIIEAATDDNSDDQASPEA